MTTEKRKPRPALHEAIVWAGPERLAASLHVDPQGYYYVFYRCKAGTLRSGPAATDPTVATSIHGWLGDLYDSDEVFDALERWIEREVRPTVSRRC